MLAIRLPEKIEKRLARLAKRTGRTKTYYAREAILKLTESSSSCVSESARSTIPAPLPNASMGR